MKLLLVWFFHKKKYRNLTQMFENIVPIVKKIILGSVYIIWLGEFTTQTVEIVNKTVNGTSGLNASVGDSIFPVSSLYDLFNQMNN